MILCYTQLASQNHFASLRMHRSPSSDQERSSNLTTSSAFLSNRHEEALLSLLRLHFRPLQNGVLATDANPLHRSRANQTQDLLAPILLARRLQRISDGEKDRGSQEQRRFPDATGSLDGPYKPKTSARIPKYVALRRKIGLT